MKRTSKRFAAWVTGLQSNIFTWARISITGLYLLIILGVLSVYSVAMYFSLLKNIEQQIRAVSTNSAVDHHLLDEAIDNLQLKIFLIDMGTFIVAAAGSYWLAGVTLQPIKRALEAQEAFSSDASHELRTPLAVMKTDIEVLLRGKTSIPEEVKATLHSSLEEINKLSLMTSELLELARGKEKVLQELVIADIVRHEVALLQVLAMEKNIALSIEGQSAHSVLADKEALSRVCKNIIANAIAYTKPGGIITVSMKDIASATTIAITDTGIGISEHDLPHVFKRFYKADNAHGTNSSGLGLAIAKHIVEQYRGTIEIKSVVSQGTTVTIKIPSKKI